MSILENINSPDDVKSLEREKLPQLCAELRRFLIANVSKTGGHLASNLGAVELTVAIHRVFDTSKDRLVFDVGHQCYVHKALTGRRDSFGTLRQYGGIAGFPKPAESVHDAFIAGHASNSISVALGMARARTILGGDYSVIALIGDGALTGGLAYEALNDAGDSGEPLIVILNDNGMAITRNVGGISRHLARLRVKNSYLSFKLWYRKFTASIPGGKGFYKFTHKLKNAIKHAVLPCSMFEDMGFQYIGPIDGHNIDDLTNVLAAARGRKAPVLVHVITTKGKGYSFSEESPDEYHGVSSFDVKEGVSVSEKETFSSVFGVTMESLARGDGRVCAITAAMTTGTGLTDFAVRFPDRFFDVGIAEGHGAAMAAGIAKQGGVPVFAVYSTFLQRSYDMLIHDVAIGGQHVVLAVDRAGLVGGDGETHHGVFDVPFLCSIPGMTVMCPASFAELREMMTYAVEKMDSPVAVRYPRGGEGAYKEGGARPSAVLEGGGDITLVSYGININTCLEAAQELKAHGVSAEVIKLGMVNPLDISDIVRSVSKTGKLVILEECVSNGCVGQRIAEMLAEKGVFPGKLVLKNLGEQFVTHGGCAELRKACGIDTAGVIKTSLEAVRDEQDTH